MKQNKNSENKNDSQQLYFDNLYKKSKDEKDDGRDDERDIFAIIVEKMQDKNSNEKKSYWKR